jgi:transposase
MLALGKTLTPERGGDLMRFDTNQHPLYCGIDLHARSMYVCILSHAGEILLHRQMKAAPEPFLKAVAPYREGLVVAVEGLFTWYGLADLCAEQAIPFVLGHARYMKAIHGGKAKHDTIDAHKMAALLRGGMLPQAYVYPAEMRATRDLLRRRTHLRRQRSALLSHVQHTNSPGHLPEIGKHIAYKANREGGAERLTDPAVHKTIAVDLALITYDDERRRDLARAMLKTATQHDAHPLYLLHTGPGIGTLLSLVRLYAIHDSGRLPSVQDCASDARLVKCSTESAGTRVGTSGKNIGNAHRKGAFAEAATLFLRHHLNGQKLLTRLEKKHGTGTALTILAPKLARAVYDMLTRQTAVDMAIFLRASRSRAGEPAVSLATPGMSLHPARGISCWAASWNAQACRGPASQSPCV